MVIALSGAQFVYVRGLHAVQFGNDWKRKILREDGQNWTRP